MILRTLFVLLLIGLGCGIGQAQLNLKIGYAGSLGAYSDLNEIHQNFTEQFDGRFEKPIGNVSYMHGLQMGFRYRKGGMGLELGLENLSQVKKSIGVGLDESITERNLTYTFNTYTLGIENYVGRWSLGASVDWRNFRTSTDLKGTNAVKKKLTRESKAASKFSISYAVQRSTNVALVIQAFTQVSWDAYDVTALNTELTGSTEATSFRPLVFGLALQFYNGRQ